jgi:hypothetical protein
MLNQRHRRKLLNCFASTVDVLYSMEIVFMIEGGDDAGGDDAGGDDAGGDDEDGGTWRVK